MDETRIFQAEQIAVRPELAGILKEYTKAMIRAQPATLEEIYVQSYEYFEKRLEAKEAAQEKDEGEQPEAAGAAATPEDPAPE